MGGETKSLGDNRSQARYARTMAWSGLALLILLSGLSFWAGQRYRKSSAWHEHSLKVLARANSTKLHLFAAESAGRGFIISQAENYHHEFERQRDLARKEYDGLRLLVEDNPRQARILVQIDELIKAKFDFVQAAIDQTRKSRMEEVVQAIREGQGAALMQSLLRSFDEFERVELDLLEERAERADREFARTGALVSAGLLLAFIFLLLNKVLLRREILAYQEIQRQLRKAELRATEASVLKSTFLANMSHEIRTPLNGIVGMTKLLENSGLNSRQSDFLETMKISANSLLALINQILDFSKIESGKMQLEEAPFELYSLIQSTVAIVEFSATAKNLRLVTTVAPDVPEFYIGDALRLRQVLLNLLNNAIKFSERGSIRLNIVRLKVWDSRASLGFEVMDEGEGMTPEILGKIFQTFTQGDGSTSRRFGGSGLGLAISKQIVEMMGGQISAESELGKGSRFHFEVTLKVSKYRAEMRPSTPAELQPMKLGAHLLVAEDNRVNQKVVAEMMKMLGCTVKIVPNGRAVLESLKSEKFDLILMDGQMPEMDGYEASSRVRAGEAGEGVRTIPIVATTANAIRGDIERCLEAGMNDYIGKPISYDDLAFKVEKWLKRGQQLIDRQAVQRLTTLSQTTGTELIPGLIELFDNESRRALADMNAALERGRFDEVCLLAHSLKTSSANLGALRLRDLADRLEKSKADPDARLFSILIGAMQVEFAAALAELKSGMLKQFH